MIRACASPAIFVIAEAGVNHGGSLSHAIDLCNAAKATGADAVKFQTFRAEDLVTADAPTAQYQRTNTGQLQQLQMLRQLELDEDAHAALKAHCDSIGLEFFSTPFSVVALQMLLRIGVRRVKLSSGELNHPQLIQAVAATGLPCILSTGMGTMVEAQQAVSWFRAVPSASADLTVLHCTSAYPAPDESLNLHAMLTMAEVLKVAIGYSDHSLGSEASICAVALGARVIEKHLTLDRNAKGPDHHASLEPSDFSKMVASIRRVSMMLGRFDKAPDPIEQETARVARRSVVLAHAKRTGDVLTLPDLVLRRPGTGLPPASLNGLLGRRLVADLPEGTLIALSDLEP